MYDASNRKDIRKAEKESALGDARRIAFLRQSLSSAEGREWFYDFLNSCHLFADPFTGDALWEAYAKGERNIGLRVFAEIIANAPDQYLRMMREATERDNVRRSTASQQPGGEDAGRDVEGSDPADDLYGDTE